jgi:hypothetical protein
VDAFTNTAGSFDDDDDDDDDDIIRRSPHITLLDVVNALPHAGVAPPIVCRPIASALARLANARATTRCAMRRPNACACACACVRVCVYIYTPHHASSRSFEARCDESR